MKTADGTSVPGRKVSGSLGSTGISVEKPKVPDVPEIGGRGIEGESSANSILEKGNYNKVKDNYLKRMGIDAHELKKDFLGRKAPISEYDIYVNKDTGELFIFKKGGKGSGIPTGEFIK